MDGSHQYNTEGKKPNRRHYILHNVPKHTGRTQGSGYACKWEVTKKGTKGTSEMLVVEAS